MKKGIIDMGTNTFHLLIADGLGTVFHDEKVPVRLGKGGISQGILSEEAMARAILTLTDFKQTMDQHHVSEIYATATSAVRSAKNQQAFLQTVKDKTGLDITVLNGEEEAFLIHQGVRQFVDFEGETALIVDIGGGSIEFIIADQDEVKWLRSYEIGGQRLIDQFHKSDPITPGEIQTLNHFLDQILAEVFDQCKFFHAAYLVGSSGSFDTFWDIYSAQHPPIPDTKPILSKVDLEEIFLELISKNKSARLAIPGMAPMRVDMIVGASVVTKNILDNCGFDRVKISPFALKEGVLAYGLPKRK